MGSPEGKACRLQAQGIVPDACGLSSLVHKTLENTAGFQC